MATSASPQGTPGVPIGNGARVVIAFLALQYIGCYVGSTAKSVRKNLRQEHHFSYALEHFGSAYFRKFYSDPATRVVTAAEMHKRAALIIAILRHVQVPVHRILDAGCGIGLLRRSFAQTAPRARYIGLESSEYLCQRFDWKKGSIVDFKLDRPVDLVVCYDVLQYLPDRQCARAIANLARLTRAALYVSALTELDWRNNCDRSRTDRAVHLRSGDWYRRRLGRNFSYLGFGVWLRKDVIAIQWEMENCS